MLPTDMPDAASPMLLKKLLNMRFLNTVFATYSDQLLFSA